MVGNQEDFQKAMNQGNSAAWDQQWSQAVGFYRQALEAIPDHPQALVNLGLAQYEMRDFDSALITYQRAASLNKDDPIPVEKIARIHERLGNLNEAIQASMQAAELYLKTRDVDKAIENWRQASSIQPDHLMARTRLAAVYDRMGQKGDAIIEYMAVASILQANGDVSKAFQVVQYVMQLAPDYPEAIQALNLLKNNQPLPKPLRPRGGTGPVMMSGVKQLDSPSSESHPGLDPIDEARQKALVKLASLLFDQNDEPLQTGQISKRGIGALTRGTGGLSSELADKNRIQLHLSQAIDSQIQGEDIQAAEELERAVEIGLSQPAVFYDLGYLNAKRDPQKAIRFLKKSASHPDFALGSYLLLGSIYEEDGQGNEAAMAYLQALRIADLQTVPSSHSVELAQLYEPVLEEMSTQKDEAVMSQLSKAISEYLLRPDWLETLQNARNDMAPQMEGNPPLPLAGMLLESRGSEMVEALALVRGLENNGHYRSAMEEAFHAIQYAPTYLPLHVQMGELLLKEGHLQEAVEKFLLASQLYSLRGEATQAVNLLLRVTQMAPMDLSVRSRLIELLTSLGRFDEAIQQYIDLADVYYKLAELDMARQTFLVALKLAQQQKANRQLMVQILNRVADIDSQRLDWRSAIRMYEQLRTLSPEDPSPRTRLINLNLKLGLKDTAMAELDGYLTLLENTEKKDRIVKFLEDLRMEFPDQVEILQKLALFHTRCKQKKEAIEVYELVYQDRIEKGDVPGATQALKDIIALEPSNLSDYQRRLAEFKTKLL